VARERERLEGRQQRPRALRVVQQRRRQVEGALFVGHEQNGREGGQHGFGDGRGREAQRVRRRRAVRVQRRQQRRVQLRRCRVEGSVQLEKVFSAEFDRLGLRIGGLHLEAVEERVQRARFALGKPQCVR
jgi:hypothetical protein